MGYVKTPITLLFDANLNPTERLVLIYLFRGQESETVEKLPDFSLPSLEAQKAIKTGTDEKSVFDSSLASSLHKQGVLERTGLDCSAQIICSSDEKTALSKANGRNRTDNHWFTKPELCR